MGVLGLLAGGAAAYYLSTRRRASNERFHLLSPSDDDESPHLGPIIPVARAGANNEKRPVVQSVRETLAGWVPGRTARHPKRRDMLAEEDTRMFDEPGWYHVRRDGSIGSWSTGRPKATIGEWSKARSLLCATPVVRCSPTLRGVVPRRTGKLAAHHPLPIGRRTLRTSLIRTRQPSWASRVFLRPPRDRRAAGRPRTRRNGHTTRTLSRSTTSIRSSYQAMTSTTPIPSSSDSHHLSRTRRRARICTRGR